MDSGSTQSGKIQLKKIGGDVNPADVLTKPKSAIDMETKLNKIGAALWRRAV